MIEWREGGMKEEQGGRKGQLELLMEFLLVGGMQENSGESQG